MSKQTADKTRIKKHVICDVKVEADLSGMLCHGNYHYRNEPEKYAKDLEKACKDFQDFLRDHRSQDMVTLTVNREYQDICFACGCEWESDYDNEKHVCANCGREVEDEALAKEEKTNE